MIDLKRNCSLPIFLAIGVISLGIARGTDAADESSAPPRYEPQAREVMAHVQKTFWDADRGIYVKAAGDRTPDYIWREAAAFSAVVAAARHDPATYNPVLKKLVKGLDAYWDAKVPIPAYEPSPTKGNGNDKYYDDNAWLVITFLEAFDQTGDRQYLAHAKATARFVASGWDDKLGGGIWWHQSHKDDSKNTCANGPAAVGYLRLARVVPANESQRWIDAARKAVEWTNERLQDKDGLFDDRVIVSTGQVMRGKLTYNSALMLRANLGLYRETGETKYLEAAKRIGKAAPWFEDGQSHIYRDPLKWSHFMVEADIELYRMTGDADALKRARTNADGYYAAWQKDKPPDMMSNVATARILWLMADLETDRGKAFWKKADAGKAAGAEK